MWEDVKKIGGLIYDQTREQKEILLLQLKIRSFSEKQDMAFSNLGRMLYPLLKTGNPVSLDDEEVRAQIENVIAIEQDVEKAGEQLKELKSAAASDRDRIFAEMDVAWEKAREAFGGKPRDEGSTTKSAETPASDDTTEAANATSGDTVEDLDQGEQNATEDETPDTTNGEPPADKTDKGV